MRISLTELLDSQDIAILDGGMGTILFDRGLQHGDSPELWNVENPDTIRAVHREYIEAGSQIILTNTFGCNRHRLELHKFADRVTEFNQAAAALAIAEAEAADKPVVVAGDIGPTGSILLPYGTMEMDEAIDVFEEQTRALIESGVDVLWIETMSDLGEVEAAIKAARNVDPDFPIVATMTFDTHGHTMMGVSPEKALETIQEFGVIAVGGNCGNGTEEVESTIEKMSALNPSLPLVAKSNAGIPHLENGVPVYDATPEIMAEYAITVRDFGARIIGGCCGSTPAHVKKMVEALNLN